MSETDILHEKEKGHEAKYKLREELRFKAECRRNKLLGLWAAERMEMPAEEAEAYARGLVGLMLQQAGLAALIARVAADCERRGAGVGAAEIEAIAEECYQKALESLAEEFPAALGEDHEPVGG